MLAVPIQPDSSDSQDLNRTIDTLVSREGFSLAEAMEMVVPPIVEEISGLPEDLHAFYMYLHQTMGPFAQGPVALIARQTDECVFSADAMGLRPLWQVETEDDYVFSSEPGVVSVAKMCSEPKPLAPGEKALVLIDRAARSSTLHPHDEMLRIVRDRWLARNGAEAVAGYERALETGGPLEGTDVPGYSDAGPEEPVKVSDRVLAGFGWQRDDVKLVQQMASNGAEPVGSLGYDGPLAALSPERQNLADYFKETVAVVTNPAIDREREMEHFSTRALFGRRPSLDNAGEDTGTVETGFPVILGGHHEPGAARRQRPTGRSPASTTPTCSRTSGRSSRGRADAVDISLLESETTQRRDRPGQAGGGEEGPQRLRAAGPHRPHRLRRRAALPRPAPGDLGDRPGAEAVQGREGRNQPAAALQPGPALGGDPQRPRRDAGPRARRQRRLPVHDGRGDLRRGLRVRRLQPLRGAAQRDRESDLDDRHPRGARLRAPVQLDRDQAGAGGDLPDRALRRLGEGGGRVRRPRRRHRRPRPRSARRRRGGETGEDVPLLPEGLQGGDRDRERDRDLRGILGEGPRPGEAEPDLDAPHHGAEGRPPGGRPEHASTPASATTTTRS